MAHNPPRIWFTDADARRIADEVARRRKWVDVDDLAEKMLARAAQGKRVVLSPSTADYVARMLKGRT